MKPRTSIACEIEGGASALAVAGDGTTAIVQGYGKKKNVQLWDLDKRKQLHAFDNESGAVLPVAITADAGLAADATYTGVEVLDAKTGAEGKWLTPKGAGFGFPRAPRFDAKGELLVIAAGKRIHGWDVKTGEHRFAWDADADEVTCLSGFFDGGRKLASGGEKGTIKVWDVASGKPVQTIAAGKAKLLALAVTEDGKTMASAEFLEPLRVWDLPGGTEVRKVPLKELPARVDSVIFLQEGKLMACTGRENTIVVEETRTGTPRYRLEGHTKAIWALVPLPGGSALASASSDDTIKVWDLK